MTRIVLKRCTHCGTQYKYCSSAYGGMPENPGHPLFCEGCLQVVQEALSHVPRCFSLVWEPTTEIALEDLLLAERAEDGKRAQGLLPNVRRVGFPSFNLETGESDRSGYIHFNGHYYHYRYWPGKESEAEITVQMEKNLQTGELRHAP